MTKQDDSNLNTGNPLALRSDNYGGGPMFYQTHDDNFLNLQRWAGAWTSRKYLKNEVAWHRGGAWIAVQDTLLEPGGVPDWQAAVGPMGRAGMDLPTPTAGTDIAPGEWRDVAGLSESLLPVGSALDPATGHFSFSYPGLWQISFALSFSHNEVNAGRKITARLYNVVDATPTGNGFIVGTGRNVGITTVNVPAIVSVTMSGLNKDFVIQIGDSDDDYKNITWQAVALNLTQLHYS